MLKVLYIEGRPSAHPLHRKFGEEINSKFIFVDFLLRWHDKDSSRGKRYLSWLLCALFLPRRKYDIIFSEGPHFVIGLQKWLKLIGPSKKTIALLDDETLYFIEKGVYSKRTTKHLIALIKTYDGIISAGSMEANLARKYAGPKAIVKQIVNGIEDVRLQKLLTINRQLDGCNIIFIGNIGAGWRGWYKGVDLLLESFEIAFKQNELLRLYMIGEFSLDLFEDLTNKHAPYSKKSIERVGFTKQLDVYLSKATLYVHPARGEAWGISVTEAMAAGVMPIVSTDTGSKEVVERVDSSYIVGLSKEEIAQKILQHINLSYEEKSILSDACRNIAAKYSETVSISCFKEVFNEIVTELK